MEGRCHQLATHRQRSYALPDLLIFAFVQQLCEHACALRSRRSFHQYCTGQYCLQFGTHSDTHAEICEAHLPQILQQKEVNESRLG